MKTPNGCNERGRITGMPGTQTTVTLYPQTLGVRMRNNIIRMLESRTIEGGWSSKARQIAQALSEKHGLQCGVNNWRGIRIIGMTDEAAPRIREVVVADWTAWLLENPEYRSGYYKGMHDGALQYIDTLDQNFYVTMHDKVAVRKVIEILAEHTTQELKEKAQQVANMLRGTEPIHLITF
jgi:hypothetical protein